MRDSSPKLFLEIIDTKRDCDELVDCADGSWEVRIVRPLGAGWRVTVSKERATIWMRRRPFVPAFRRQWRP